ncbi:hypothetical protein EDD18DRAFT_1189949 [Armillaria luteobubalina]|uniref:Uncharacterized protein n=1 Tax=Armillaria luteobubalina TaxID=153913 RepID=A0AA39UHG7_9AGAR|nr:hypothetical protein EDD18DRAFT_1189949 [Armillaria luteobubalina]
MFSIYQSPPFLLSFTTGAALTMWSTVLLAFILAAWSRPVDLHTVDVDCTGLVIRYTSYNSISAPKFFDGLASPQRCPHASNR